MMRSRPLLFTLFILFCPIFALAQGGQQGADNSLLPEINPQDIEIRSEFQARFPGLRRQPILGFNPKPRVFQIDPNRMPFMETREEAVADISITQLGRPEPPQRSVLTNPDRINAYIRGGFGSFITPELNGYGFYKLNEKSLISADVNMRASDGHLDNQESSFRYLDANVSYITKVQDDLRLTIDVGGLSDYNDLFNLSDNLQQNFIGKTSNKSYSGGSAQLSLQQSKNTLTGWRAALGGNVFNTSLDAGNSGLSGDLDEQIGHATFSYYWPGNRLYETFDISASLEAGNYSNPVSSDQSWVDAGASFEYERLLNFSTRISGKGGIEYISDPTTSKVYFTPEIRIKHNFSNALSISGTAFAKPEMQTQQSHHQYNRFLNVQNQLRHAYHLGTTGEVNFQLFDGNRIFGGVNYRHVKDYAYYRRQTLQPSNTAGFYNVNYADANIFELYAGASQQLLPEKFWFDGKVYVRSPKLSGGGFIPYEEKLGVEGAISYKVIKELTINGWAEYIGSREAPAANSDLSAYVLLNAGVEYQINDTFGVYAKLLNLLGQEYEIWNGYQERPFQVFGGLTIKF
ncbi:hypothetical protein [Gracilimonas sediminicola]|uniref:TonB-dependent receptor n=1 Tax=Gracilimonas sediminicola TaxID=2952158 RepID=A0A9X2L309_9BACT|nr:hypothetical protein [Gracilimonas sediminicola]MCP9291334.1 hypothetical protein [Gracilimonas sediminicola]